MVILKRYAQVKKIELHKSDNNLEVLIACKPPQLPGFIKEVKGLPFSDAVIEEFK